MKRTHGDPATRFVLPFGRESTQRDRERENGKRRREESGGDNGKEGLANASLADLSYPLLFAESVNARHREFPASMRCGRVSFEAEGERGRERERGGQKGRRWRGQRRQGQRIPVQQAEWRTNLSETKEGERGRRRRQPPAPR